MAYLADVMLWIDPGRAVASLPLDAAPSPYLARDFRGQRTRAHAYLARAASLDRLIPALLKELSRPGLMQRIRVSLPMLILAEAADAVARGSIAVAQPAIKPATLVFLGSQPTARRDDDAVRFVRQQTAVDYLRPFLGKPATRQAIDAAIGYPGGGNRPPPSTTDSLLVWLAAQLVSRRLGLFPLPGIAGGLRIAWIDRQAPTRADPPPAAAPPPAPPPPPPVQTAANPLPDLPDYVSAQAQTLIDAATEGVPFCEECARAAAAAAAQGV